MNPFPKGRKSVRGSWPYSRKVQAKRKFGYWLWERGVRMLPEAEQRDVSNWIYFGAAYCPGNFEMHAKKYRVDVREVIE